jgi:hypothetical protein
MKTRVIALLVASVVLASSKAWAVIYIPSPPGNIVRNGTFEREFDYWNGIPAIFYNPHAPNGVFAVTTDIYQDLPTSPGQQYSLDFYAAADLFLDPSLTFAVALNSQPMVSFTTIPYPYNPIFTPLDQMPWTEYTFSFTASAGTTRLEFIDMNTFYFGLAAVSVVPVPEPATTALMLVAGAVIVCWSRWPSRAKSNNSAR